MAQPSQDGIKEKVLAVREVVPGRSNNEIILVLTYYDYSVEGAIQAFLEDGAKTALEEWHYPGNKPNNKKKKKKQQKKAEQAAKDAQQATTAAAAAAAAAVAPEDGKLVAATKLEPTPDFATKNVERTENSPDENKSKTESASSEREVKPEIKLVVEPEVKPDVKPEVKPEVKLELKPEVKLEVKVQVNSDDKPEFKPVANPEVTQVIRVSELKPAEMPADNHVQTKTSAPKNSSSEAFLEKMSQAAPVINVTSRPQSQQRRPHTLETSSSRASRERLLSEVSVSSATSSTQGDRPAKVKPHAGLERSTKDLQRQTVSLQRLKQILVEEVEKSFKTMSAVFDGLRLALNEREAELMFDMDKIKVQANDTLQRRQNRAVELKVRTDRAPGMSDGELAELRADIKHFVSERKVDEDLTKAARFTCEEQDLLTQIKAFGEISPVKHAYSVRRPSISSVSSSIISHDEALTPLTPTTPILSASSNATTAPFLSHSNLPSTSPSLPVTSSHDMAVLAEKFTSAVSIQDTRPATPAQKSASTSPIRPIQSAPSSDTKPQESDTDNGEVRKPRNAKRRQKLRHRDRGGDSVSSESSTTVINPTSAPSDNLERKQRPQQNGPRPVANRGTSPMKQSNTQPQGRQGQGQRQEGQWSNSHRGGQGQRIPPQGYRDQARPAAGNNEQQVRPQNGDSYQNRQAQGQSQGQSQGHGPSQPQRRQRERRPRGPRSNVERNEDIANGVANGDGPHHQEAYNNLKMADAGGDRSKVPLNPNDLKVSKLNSSTAPTSNKPAAASSNHNVIENETVENTMPKAQRGPRNRGARHAQENRKSQLLVNGDHAFEVNGHS